MFAFEFLFRHKELFIVYALDEFEKQLYGRIKSYQRWEQCLHHLLQQHGPALQALHAVTYFNKEIQDSVKEFTKEAVHDFIVEVNKLNIDSDTKKDVVGKLNNIKYIIGYPEEVLDLQKIEILYEELELNGTEGLVETFLKMKRNSEKIKNNPSSNWKIKALKMSARNLVSFVTDDNSLCEFE